MEHRDSPTEPISPPSVRARDPHLGRPRTLRDDLTDLHLLAIESESLIESLSEVLSSLPPQLLRETTCALASVAEEKARKMRERIDELIEEVRS